MASKRMEGKGKIPLNAKGDFAAPRLPPVLFLRPNGGGGASNKMEFELELPLNMDQDYIAPRSPPILFPRSDGGGVQRNGS